MSIAQNSRLGHFSRWFYQVSRVYGLAFRTFVTMLVEPAVNGCGSFPAGSVGRELVKTP